MTKDAKQQEHVLGLPVIIVNIISTVCFCCAIFYSHFAYLLQKTPFSCFLKVMQVNLISHVILQIMIFIYIIMIYFFPGGCVHTVFSYTVLNFLFQSHTSVHIPTEILTTNILYYAATVELS